MNSLFPDICSTDLPACKTFYESLLGMTTVFELDWYLQLQSPTDENLQIAFVAQDHDSVPAGFGLNPQGVIVTIETDDVDPVYRRALSLKLPIVRELKDEEWGQRHFMARDPNGLLVDLVQMIEPGEAYTKHF
jgi:catechol 2,3-dioxygenase-like lactoylglutathione lyase family enzyme